MENIGINLYLAIGTAECSANNLMKSEAQGNLFAIVNKKLKDDKTIRYSKDEDFLEHIFNVEKEKDTAKKECNICHNLVDKLWKYNSDEEIACEFCLNLYKLGQDILTQDLVFVISEKKIDDSIKIFGKDKDLYMYAVKIEDIDMFKGKILRIYSKNNLLENDLAIRLYLADYSAKNENDEVMTFDGDKFNKLSVGKSLIYRLMDLIQLADEDKLNIARFAYVLARMQPKQDKDEQKRKVYEDFVSKMYQWINNNEDKKQLATALNLLVYYLRDKKE